LRESLKKRKFEEQVLHQKQIVDSTRKKLILSLIQKNKNPEKKPEERKKVGIMGNKK
jgi:hypothetical protein